MFAVLQDLNLKLETAKATLPVIVVDSVRPPSEN
jgi:uncharacterized protein (TIGR03435 family)